MKTLVHEEQYRGAALLKKMEVQSFSICGAGAIGSNLVGNLVRQGCKRFSVIDFDRVDDHNRHTQVWSRRDVGQLKVAALRNYVFTVMGVAINPVSKKLELSNIRKLIKTPTLVIDGFDNMESRKIVTEHCRDQDIDCLHVGLYKDCAEVCWNESYRVPDNVKGTDICEYPLARNVILMAVAVASDCIIRFIESGVKESYFITLKDFKIDPMVEK